MAVTSNRTFISFKWIITVCERVQAERIILNTVVPHIMKALSICQGYFVFGHNLGKSCNIIWLFKGQFWSLLKPATFFGASCVVSKNWLKPKAKITYEITLLYFYITTEKKIYSMIQKKMISVNTQNVSGIFRQA